jgi:hypothetical protein
MWASKVIVLSKMSKSGRVDGDHQPASRFVGWPGEKRDRWGYFTAFAAETRGTSECFPPHPSSLFVHHTLPAT